MIKTVFERRGGEKGGENLGLQRGVVLDGFASHFLLLRDQATYKKKFDEAKGRVVIA